MHPLTRCVVLLLVAMGASARLSAQTASAPLARGHWKFLGSAHSASQLRDFGAYFNQVTPENGGKWGSVEPTRDVMNWADLDLAYQFAKANRLPFKMHNLIWGSQQPAWIDALPPADQLNEIKQWIAAVAARYPDVDMIDVVNEPIRAAPSGAPSPNGGRFANYSAALGGAGATGWDWVVTSFRLARSSFPKAKLLLNEYSITNETAVMQTYVGIVNLLKAEGLIDGVGVQAHAFSTRYVSAATTKANLDLLAATGVPIYASELDIDGPTDEAQLAEYQRVFPVFWEHPGVVGVTLWGFRPGLWRSTANLIKTDGTERSAMSWLRTYLAAIKPAFSTQPQSAAVGPGGSAVFTAAVASTPAPSLKWQRNGTDLAGATSGSLTVANVQVASTGVYTALATGVSAAVSSKPAILGLTTTAKATGDAHEIGTNITHPNGKKYDQVSLDGASAAVKAAYSEDPALTRVTRMSFIDTDDDIVQVEFSGPGTLSLVLSSPSGPAAPAKYIQPGATYMRGHAGIVITDATENTNVTVFSVGRDTAVNQGLFRNDVTYDGLADIAFIAISSANGRFGGLRAANSTFFASQGLTGVYAPGVTFTGPVFVGDILAFGDATPVLQIGAGNDVRITGGALEQPNGKAVQVSGLTKLAFTPGSDSHKKPLDAQANRGVLEEDGVDVTNRIVVNP